ncbi:hypothetical protein [Lysinibacillus sp. FW12]|uniref:hypothetical protein n=1 Tax=Lysinibacillus sp. FW12 TaxID=3096079 RepID=UPI003D72FF44
MNIIDLATKTMQTAIKTVVDGIKTTTDTTKNGVDEIKQGVGNISNQIANKNAGKVKRSVTFLASGRFAVPAGVTEVYITGGGAGGGGACGLRDSQGGAGGAGGVTSFGTALTLAGGGGAQPGDIVRQFPGVAGGQGGQSGGITQSEDQAIGIGGFGGNSGPFFGGIGRQYSAPLVPYESPNCHGGYCSGGGGTVITYYAPGGGGGDFVYQRPIAVTPLSWVDVTIGIGGAAGSTIYNGFPIYAGRGGNGILIVEWWE